MSELNEPEVATKLSFIKSNHLVITTSLSIVMLLVGVTIGKFLPDKATSNFEEIRTDNKYKYINPLLECEGAAISQSTNLNSLKEELETTIREATEKKEITIAAVYYRDLNNGPWFSIEATEQFAPASLLKVPLLMAYLKQSELTPEILEETIIAASFDYEKEQNVLPEKQLIAGQSYSIKELIEQAIIYSDNYAYYILMQSIDDTLMDQMYADMGMVIKKGTNTPAGGDIISVREYSSFFRVLFNASYLNRENSEYALGLLAKSAYDQGLTKYLPNVEVSHKFGERHYEQNGETQLHDCGIVYMPQEPYLLCIMTTGTDLDTQANIVGRLSEQVYNYIKVDN